jgi:hypothetical protein
VVLAHNYSGYTLEITRTNRQPEATINELSALVEITPRIAALTSCSPGGAISKP